MVEPSRATWRTTTSRGLTLCVDRRRAGDLACDLEPVDLVQGVAANLIKARSQCCDLAVCPACFLDLATDAGQLGEAECPCSRDHRVRVKGEIIRRLGSEALPEVTGEGRQEAEGPLRADQGADLVESRVVHQTAVRQYWLMPR